MIPAICHAEKYRHRVGAGFGGYFPLGNIDIEEKSIDLKPGTVLSVDYQYTINEFFSIGGFLERTNFSSERIEGVYSPTQNIKAKARISSTIIGGTATLRNNLGQITVYGSGGFGIAYNKPKLNVDLRDSSFQTHNMTITDNDTTLVVFIEGGGWYHITEIVDLSLSLKYTYNNAVFEGEDADLI